MFLLILGRPAVYHGDLAGLPHELPLGKFDGLVILLSWGGVPLDGLVLCDHKN